MGKSFQLRNFDPKNPIRTMNSSDGFIVRLLRNSANGFAKSQAFNTGAATTITFDGDLCMNPIVRGATDTTQAILPMPGNLWFTTAGAVAISDGRIEGVDHLGREQVIEFTKTSGQTVFTPSTATVTVTRGPSIVCWSSIRRVVMTNTTSNTTITVGTSYVTGASPTARLPLIPLPVPISEVDPSLSVNGAHLGDGFIVASAGGATWVSPAAVPGRATHATPKLAEQTAVLTTNFSVAPTSEFEIFVPYRPGYVGAC